MALLDKAAKLAAAARQQMERAREQLDEARVQREPSGRQAIAPRTSANDAPDQAALRSREEARARR